MYSPKIIERHTREVIEGIRQRTGNKKFELKRYDIPYCQQMARDLAKFYDAKGRLKPDAKISPEQQQFIVNEQLLVQIDFRYWAARYCHLEHDAKVGGGIRLLKLWEPQELLLQKMGAREERCHEQLDAGEQVDGILICANKSRQVGFTAIFRALSIHRLTSHKYVRGLAASIDESYTEELYVRDKIIIDHLPPYLRPFTGTKSADVKTHSISFERLKSRLNYQWAVQKALIGIGRQFDVTHLTEASQWPNPTVIELGILGAVPQSINTLVGVEAVPNGRNDWWHEWTERVRLGKLPRWSYVFIPWYAEPKKYNRTPPAKWSPSDVALLHAKKVEETSSEYVGKTIRLSRDQLYWWESTRQEYLDGGSLNLFLTNYSATPEESFQHSGKSAFDVMLLERLRNRARPGVPYEVQITA